MNHDQLEFRLSGRRGKEGRPEGHRVGQGPRDGVPFVRRSDTSKAAGDSVARSSRSVRVRVIAAITAAGLRGATCDQLELQLGLSHQTCSARIRELTKSGVIVDGGCRRPTRSGRGAVVWVIADVTRRQGEGV